MREIFELIERLEKLERQNRWMKRGALALTAGLAVTLFMGAGGNKPEVLDEIRVKKLVIEDDAGTIRCQLDASNKGTILQLNDRSGSPRVAIFTDAKSGMAGMNVRQKDGKMRLGMGCRNDGNAWVRLFKARGNATKGLDIGR